MGLKNDQSAFMTTAEALAKLRGCLDGEIHWEGVGPRPWWEPLDFIEERLRELEAFRLRGNARRLAEAEAERDNATAALERMRLELLRVDKMVSRYSQSADAVSEDRARWMERYAELEAALREGGCQFYIDGDIGACQKHQEADPCPSCRALGGEKRGQASYVDPAVGGNPYPPLA